MNTAEKEDKITDIFVRILDAVGEWADLQENHFWNDMISDADLIEDFIEHLRKIPENSC